MHAAKVERLQEQLRSLNSPVVLHSGGASNTTRSKSYKNQHAKLELSDFNEVLSIDPIRKIAHVEPRVTMEKLVRACLRYNLIPPVVPEFKGITVGGAINGWAIESSSHRWGSFNDICQSFELLCGNGTVIKCSREENSDIFFGIPGSYGSLGALMSAEIKLIPAKPFVHLHYHVVPNPLEVLTQLKSDFVEAIVFSKESGVVIEGNLSSTAGTPLFSTRPFHAEWFYQHAKRQKNNSEEWMPIEDYIFRYDTGAFWMGSYLFQLPLLARFLGQGLFKLFKEIPENYNSEEVDAFQRYPGPSLFSRACFRPFMGSQNLWKLMHKNEKFLQDRVIIQDFCIPQDRAARFLNEAMDEPATFPIWLCAVKATSDPQIFSPHLNPAPLVIDIGLYGLPRRYRPMEEIGKQLEEKTEALGGRKMLYSRSDYSLEDFWRIYSRNSYDILRKKTHAQGVWHHITDKVLSS